MTRWPFPFTTIGCDTKSGDTTHGSTSSPFQRRYPPELRERAVRMVPETASERGERFGAFTRVAGQLGIGPESLRKWVHQAEVDGGKRTA